MSPWVEVDEKSLCTQEVDTQRVWVPEFSRGTGGIDAETNELFDAHFECHDCGTFYSWPVTPGLAAIDDPKQTEMLALVNGHTPETCQAILEAAAEATKAEKYAVFEKEVYAHADIASNFTVDDAVLAELRGMPMPFSGDRTVTLQEAIDRGAVTITKGLPPNVLFRRSNPSLTGTLVPFQWVASDTSPTSPARTMLGMWPTPSHEALTESITALAGNHRQTAFTGWLRRHGGPALAD
ncbi:hypothetical protein [Specibacter sp. NPDC078692]|uniref:hypothetical protein n=1 Tax=Specibacter sp. NPDC078692 TaxID=3155818 RepID=UPI003419FE61